LKKFLTQLEGSATDEVVELMMAVADRDKDGFISFKEFQAVIKD